MQTSNRFRRILERRWNQGTTSPSLTPEEFLSSITLIPDINLLLESFTVKFKEIFGAGSVYLMLLEPVTGRYIGRKTKGDKPELLPEFNLSRSDNLIKWLNVNESPLFVPSQQEVMKYLSAAERQLVLKAGIQVVMPLIVINRLTGALFVGKKTNNENYSPWEIGMMSSLAGQSALAIESALIYQFQEDRLKSLFHADKLVTVGELAAGAAHEIRNPLAAIRSTVQYIQKDLSPDKKTLVQGVLGVCRGTMI